MEPSQLSRPYRLVLVQEIERWQKEGLIPAELATALRKRYDYDFPSSAAAPVPPAQATAAAPAPAQAQPGSPPVPRPRLSLAQTLLSETSIRIYLYLGAFFVISAAMILAVLVAGLRLPILLAVTVLFGAGSLLLKRRLPQPSFILYLVFSALLPITAGVLADLAKLAGRASSTYWLVVLLAMALVWAFSAWLFSSRFFSLTALLALDGAAAMAGRLASEPRTITFLFFLTLSSLAGLVGAFLLKRWRGQKFALPVFILAQVQQALFLLVATSALLDNLVTNEFGWQLVSTGTWILATGFYALSDAVIPFLLFPWATAAALMPVGWLAIVRSGSGPETSAFALVAWGMLMTAAGNLFLRFENRVRHYSLPVGLAAVPLLLAGSLVGLYKDAWLGLGLFLGSGVLLALFQIVRPRPWVWTFSLGFGLAAYLTFFHIPPTALVENYICSQLAGATLLLMLPDMLLPSSKALPGWRWPLRGWAILAASATLLSGLLILAFGSHQDVWVMAVTLGLAGLLYLAYALRLRKAWLGGLFTLHLALALTFGLSAYEVHAWLPILAGLAMLFYVAGALLAWKGSKPWSVVLRASALTLAGVLCLAAFLYDHADRAIYVTVLASLFLTETFRTAWLETFTPAFYSIAFIMTLIDGKVEPRVYFPAGITILFLGLDLLFTRLKAARPLKWATRLLGATAACVTLVLALLPKHLQGAAAIACGVLASLFVLQALVYRQPRLGYIAAAFLSFSVLFTNLKFVPDRWLWSLIGTAIVFYALSLPRGLQRGPGWDVVLRCSGLGLASLTALSAPLERSGLLASLPVALAASLWAVEAFRRRNVWLGFPANGLYLMAYFMILATLKVDQPQFFSVGAAVLGLLMHYLLRRAGSRAGAFLTGLFSQLVLLSTTYIQMTGTKDIWYFAVLFFQALVVLGYGIVIRSRSLVITPIVMLVLGVATVVFSILHDISTVILIGCTGIGLILAGIAALLLRERIASLRDQLRDWHA
ncbi:MAG TPA: hypothetical protein VMC09_02615 [Anaerolineales bacterium]|nr:hypothetical protein [Anaerolineales bacterium]